MDVMNYILELQHNPKAKPASYWKNTSDNAIIRSFIDYAGSNITEKAGNIASGGAIIQHIDENLTYDYLHSSEENLWSILYLTGYLTRARDQNYNGELPEGTVALVIPNEEIREIFETTVKNGLLILQKSGIAADYLRQSGLEMRRLLPRRWQNFLEKRSVTMITKKTFTIHSSQESLQEPVIRWTPIRSTEKAEVMS